MKLTEKEQKLARLALDKGCQPGERQNAAAKLIESLFARGVKVEDIIAAQIEYRDVEKTVYRDRPAAAAPKQQPKAQPKQEPYFQPPPPPPESQWRTWPETFKTLGQVAGFIIAIFTLFSIGGSLMGSSSSPAGRSPQPTPTPSSSAWTAQDWQDVSKAAQATPTPPRTVTVKRAQQVKRALPVDDKINEYTGMTEAEFERRNETHELTLADINRHNRWEAANRK
jgi:hypothetical protein